MRDFTEHGFGIRVGDGYCVGVMRYVEDGERHPLPLLREFDSVQAIPTSRVAIAFKAYAHAHPDDGLHELLTGLAPDHR